MKGGAKVPTISAGNSDIGMKRKSNQDSIYFSDELAFYLVADGMGGHSGGDIASQLCVKLMPDYISSHKEQDPKNLLANASQHVNAGIFRKALDQIELKGMGTTLVCSLFKDGVAHIANVGDSRCYLINDHLIYQLTKDHSWVQEKLDMGIYDRNQAKLDKQKNVLRRSVGYEERVDADVFAYKYKPNDLFLLCSDGLHGKVTDHDIITIVNKNITDLTNVDTAQLKKVVDELIAQANQNGGQDNISVIAILAK